MKIVPSFICTRVPRGGLPAKAGRDPARRAGAKTSPYSITCTGRVEYVDFYDREEVSPIRTFMSWIVDIVVVLAFAWFCLHSFGRQIVIAGQSMMPLLNSGDVVLMNRLIYDFRNPQRLDVVVFEREDNKTNVKRVIGLPGEEVLIQGGYVYINGERLEAGEELDRVSLAGLAENPVKLGEDEYFLLGDNRDSSEDSRFANVGNVRESQIKGKVWLRIYPLMDIRLIPAG